MTTAAAAAPAPADAEMSFLQKYLSRSPIEARKHKAPHSREPAPATGSDYGGSQETHCRKLAKDFDFERALNQFSGLVDKSTSEFSAMVTQQKDCCTGLKEVTKELSLMRTEMAALVGVLNRLSTHQQKESAAPGQPAFVFSATQPVSDPASTCSIVAKPHTGRHRDRLQIVPERCRKAATSQPPPPKAGEASSSGSDDLVGFTTHRVEQPVLSPCQRSAELRPAKRARLQATCLPDTSKESADRANFLDDVFSDSDAQSEL